MSDLFSARNTTVLADLGPLPEVVESNTEASWRMFLELEAQHAFGFRRTEPSSLGAESTGPSALGAESIETAPRMTVDEVMVEARRLNRVCPKDRLWQQLCALLHEAVGTAPPSPILAPESPRTPQLVKRARFREQVEWASRNGQLQLVFGFMKSLAEEQWTHIGS
jgi:hypothetical protein